MRKTEDYHHPIMEKSLYQCFDDTVPMEINKCKSKDSDSVSEKIVCLINN